MQKVIFIICDGLPDRPIKELGNKTPLEVPYTPNLDRIAVDGINGMMHTVGVGIRPGSDTSHLSIFGYDPYVFYSGRGPYECIGIGMDVRQGDVAFRANAATLDDCGILVDRRVDRIDSTKPIVDFLGTIRIDSVSFTLKESLGHRIGMVMSGPNLSPRVSDNDPHKCGVTPYQVRPLDETMESSYTANILNRFSEVVNDRLRNCPFNIQRIKEGKKPANTIIFRGAGEVPGNFLTFEEKYKLKAAFIAGAPMYRGIAKLLGMEIVQFSKEEGVNGFPNSNLKLKIKRAIELTEFYDIIFVHIKAADSLAEDGNYIGKVKFIERIDEAMAPLAKSNDFIVVVTADHTTSSQLRMHTADPVPVTIKGDGVRTDDISYYSERECAKGRLGVIRGENLMPIIIDLMGLAELYGA